MLQFRVRAAACTGTCCKLGSDGPGQEPQPRALSGLTQQLELASHLKVASEWLKVVMERVMRCPLRNEVAPVTAQLAIKPDQNEEGAERGRNWHTIRMSGRAPNACACSGQRTAKLRTISQMVFPHSQHMC
jgi:hypothetical protein